MQMKKHAGFFSSSFLNYELASNAGKKSEKKEGGKCIWTYAISLAILEHFVSIFSTLNQTSLNLSRKSEIKVTQPLYYIYKNTTKTKQKIKRIYDSPKTIRENNENKFACVRSPFAAILDLGTVRSPPILPHACLLWKYGTSVLFYPRLMLFRVQGK